MPVLKLLQSRNASLSVGSTAPRRSRPGPGDENDDDTLARERCLILVVDDDDSLRSIVEEFLKDEGFRVKVARNGVEALASINATQPTLVVLDMYLPVMDGWSFANELRTKGIDVPIIVMSAARHARQCARDIGAAAYVAKPVSLPTLLKRIDDLCA